MVSRTGSADSDFQPSDATGEKSTPDGGKKPRGRLGRATGALLSAVRGLPRRTVRGVRTVVRAARQQPRRALVAMAVAVVVLGAASGLFAVLSSQQSSTDSAAADATATAKQSLVTLLSYDYRTVGNEVAQRQALTTGQFHDEYGSLIKDVVTPSAQQQKTVTQTQVVNAAPTEAVSPLHCSVLLFLNQTTTTAAKADPTFSGSRVRVGLDNVDGRWLISDVTPV